MQALHTDKRKILYESIKINLRLTISINFLHFCITVLIEIAFDLIISIMHNRKTKSDNFLKNKERIYKERKLMFRQQITCLSHQSYHHPLIDSFHDFRVAYSVVTRPTSSMQIVTFVRTMTSRVTRRRRLSRTV